MAGRIPQDFIDDLLNRTDIADVVEERITLKRTGRNYSGLCPFHKEKTPSFSVNPEKQFYYCFGCGAGGNAIGFVMEHDRVDFPEAITSLAQRLGLEIPQEASSQEPKNQKLKTAYSLLKRSADYYQQQLRSHPERAKAVAYLKGRGLSGQIAKQFLIGYAPPGWDNLIKHLDQPQSADSSAVNEQKASREDLDDAGLVILKPEDNKCYDRFRDRIIFPIVDMRGRVIAFGGRVLTDEKPKYLNSPETDTFHKNRELYGLYQARQANRELNRILIVEGYMDVVSLAQFGINNTVATLGTATSEHHLTRLYKLLPEVVFCFDGDDAGRKAAKRALETALPIMEDGRQARFLFLPDGEDPDTLVRREGSEEFERRINQAKPLSDFFFESHSEGLDLHSGEGRARLSSLAMPLIEQIPGQVFKQIMKQQLSELAGLSSDFFDHSSVAPSTGQQAAPHPSPDHSASHNETVYNDSPFDGNLYNSSPYEGDPYNDNAYYEAPSSGNWTQNSKSSFNSKANFNSNSSFKRKNQRLNYRPQEVLKPSSLGTKALKTLLHFPQLALKVDFETTEALSEPKEPELLLLKALIEQLRKEPETNAALILMDWEGDPNHNTLREITEQELLFKDSSSLESELINCLHQLVKKKAEEAKLDYLLKRKKQTPLTDEEKQLLNKLLKGYRTPLP
ncbi:DNA primase [Motiliproteus sp. MSK22-1]|uniref:DNA primase n=1 Tax=Motiliproteus sp. MSK22-1 TaxID=1897630 RepID=UPI000978A85B|nr:DNA primase [Motiliproteus sp. MSK22-1]OMH32145.1 DNA primase [Motiliproteus sp. MSK22-1]